MRTGSWPVLLGLSTILTSGCKPDGQQIPSYIRIDSFTVTTNYATQGSASHKITNPWVFVNDDAQGVFELPTLAPLLFAGNHEISILAGVLKDGKSVERIVYPFYSLFSQDVLMNPGGVDTLMPTVSYLQQTTFLAIEDWDAGSSAFGITRTTDPTQIFEGNGSGIVQVDQATPTVITESDLLPIPANGSEVFLELDYKNESVFDIFLHDTETLQDHYIITITPKSIWNKVYVDLTAPVNRNPADEYRIKFRSDLAAGDNQAINLWDNIKILHL